MQNSFEFNLHSSTLETLMQHTRDGLEATVGSWLLPRRARQQAEATRILSAAEADRLRIIAKGEADAAKTILEASPETDTTIELSDEAQSLYFGFQTQKRFKNIRQVVRGAARELEGIEVEHHRPNPDWSARLFQDAQDVSPEQLQNLWSKILAGEIRNPGQTSLRTLNVLKNMSQQDAITFEEVSKYVIANTFLYSRNSFASHEDTPGTTLNYGKMMLMQECGLVSGSLNSSLPLNQESNPNAFPYYSILLLVEKGADANDDFNIPVVALTTAGQELCKTMNHEIQMSYLQDFAKFLHQNQYSLYRLEGFQTQPDGSYHYSSKNKIPIMHD